MTKSSILCEIDLIAYARLFTYESIDETTCAVTGLASDELARAAEIGSASEPVHLVIPSVAPDGRVVVAIGPRAFEGRQSLRAVTLPDSVVSIGRRAFAFCTGLVDLRTGHESRLSVLGDRAFLGCERLTVLHLGHLEELRSLGRSAFAHCTRLRGITLPEGLTELSPSLFDGCTALTHVHLPRTLVVVNTAAFSACTALCTLRLPASVRVIEDCAFAFCGRLSELRLPDAACIISASAFRDCVTLGNILKVS